MTDENETGRAADRQHHHDHHQQHQHDQQHGNMTPSSSVVSPVVKATVIVGIFLLRIVSSVPWIWGNLAAYVTSYYYAKGDNSSGSLTNWIISVEIITFNIAMTIGNSIAKKIGLRTTLFLGLVLFNAGIFLTHVSVKQSVIALCVTFAGIPGFAGGLVEVVQLKLVVKWTDRYLGLATTSVQSAVVLGGVVLNFLLTWYINPDNEAANTTVEDNKVVFAQPDLVERVPYVFLLYGALSTVLNLIGFLLVRGEPGEKDFFTEMTRRLMSSWRWWNSDRVAWERVGLISSEERVDVSNLTNSNSMATSSTNHSTNTNTSSHTCYTFKHLHDDDDCHDVINENDSNTNHSNGISTGTTTSSARQTDNNYNDSDTDSNAHTTNTNTTTTTIPDFTPRQVLKLRSFYALLFFKLVQTYGFFILNTYYKSFGLLFIHDDHFLTVIAMLQCLVIPVCTWIAGFALDKFGVKPTLTSISGVFCILTSFFYLTPVNKWLYLFSCLFYGGAMFTLSCLTGACCVKLYGETHFTTINGMTFVSCYVVVPLLPPATEWIVSAFGWFTLFISVGVLALLNVCGLLWGLPPRDDKTYKICY